MDLTLTRETIKIEAISHGGQVRSTTIVRPRPSNAQFQRDADAQLHLKEAQQALQQGAIALAEAEAEASAHANSAAISGNRPDSPRDRHRNGEANIHHEEYV